MPYSNDMWPNHPVKKNFFPDLPLMEGEQTIAFNPDQNQLTRQYTERSVHLIEKNKDRPFFLYLAHTMPHVPLAFSDRFQGKSGRGIYGDVLLELDWSLGEILDALKRVEIDETTVLVFLSDNGPWLSYGDHAAPQLAQRVNEGMHSPGNLTARGNSYPMIAFTATARR